MHVKPSDARLKGGVKTLILLGVSMLLQGASVKTWGLTSSQTTQQKAPSLVPQYHALVIGINAYKKRRGDSWAPLRTALPDAVAVANVLEQQYEFEVTRLFDKQATRSAIITALDQTTRLSENDALLIYYAGHGHYEPMLDEGYWIPSDARKQIDGRYAKEDWIWNSVTTKILRASPARHILVVADACFSGSLFRGEAQTTSPREHIWYRRSIAKPSRYLITSSNYDEPSPDSGIDHSDFAMHVLNYLRYTDADVFSASELGVAIREKISMKSGRLVRMGPLPDARHADGEFVFLRQDSEFLKQASQAIEPEPLSQQRSTTPLPSDPTPTSLQQTLQDAIITKQRGATNAAYQLINNLTGDIDNDPMLETVKMVVQQENQFTPLHDLQRLLDELAKREQMNTQNAKTYKESTVPRIIACIGPQVHAKGTDAESLSMLYRVCLQAELKRHGGIRVVVREALDAFFRERQLANTNFSDDQLRHAFSKLLPAGMLLLGELFLDPDGDVVVLRLADAGSTELLGTCTVEASKNESVYQVCKKLADQVVALAKKKRPLHARVLQQREGLLEAAVGSFHGADPEIVYDVLQRVHNPRSQRSAYIERDVGDARIVRLGENSSDLTTQWLEESPVLDLESLWIREKQP